MMLRMGRTGSNSPTLWSRLLTSCTYRRYRLGTNDALGCHRVRDLARPEPHLVVSAHAWLVLRRRSGDRRAHGRGDRPAEVLGAGAHRGRRAAGRRAHSLAFDT